MRIIITDNLKEEVSINSDEDRIGLTRIKKDAGGSKTIILNKREAIAVYGFIGRWAREEK